MRALTTPGPGYVGASLLIAAILIFASPLVLPTESALAKTRPPVEMGDPDDTNDKPGNGPSSASGSPYYSARFLYKTNAASVVRGRTGFAWATGLSWAAVVYFSSRTFRPW